MQKKEVLMFYVMQIESVISLSFVGQEQNNETMVFEVSPTRTLGAEAYPNYAISLRHPGVPPAPHNAATPQKQ